MMYREDLMAIYKDPNHKGHVPNPDITVFQKNPMCGDEIHLELKIEDGVISDAKFNGSACSVSIISSSVLLDNLIGMKLEDAKKYSKEELLKTLDLNLSTSRVSCATLILNALKEAIDKYETNR